MGSGASPPPRPGTVVPHRQLSRALLGNTAPVGILRPPLVTATPSGVGDAGGTPRPSRDRGLAPCRHVRGTLGSVWRGWPALPDGTGASAAPRQGEGRGQAGRVGSRKGAPGLAWGGPQGPPSQLLGSPAQKV